MSRYASVAFVAAWIPLLAQCSRGGSDDKPTPSASSTSIAHAAPRAPDRPSPPKGTLALGEPITSRFVALADIANSPARYQDQLVATTGKVTAVCQEMGCWMEIGDESAQAHIKMHGHAFFVPKTASGHMARVQARVLRSNEEECSESPPPQQKHAVAKVELDATGVELD
jgi:hypothetical protein